jgi:hypothetical protein
MFPLLKHMSAFSAERRIDQVCSDTEYRKVFERLRGIPHGVEHLIIQLGLVSNELISVSRWLKRRENRHSNCISPDGVFGERVGVQDESPPLPWAEWITGAVWIC